jgi:nitrate/nitrite transporter NarK
VTRTPFFWPRFVLALVLMLTVIPAVVIYKAAREWVPYFLRGFFGTIGYNYMTNVHHLQQAVSEHKR